MLEITWLGHGSFQFKLTSPSAEITKSPPSRPLIRWLMEAIVCAGKVTPQVT